MKTAIDETSRMTFFISKKYSFVRIATKDICELGKKKHHIVAHMEADVTMARKKLREYRKRVGPISFTSWVVKTVCSTLENYPRLAAFSNGKRGYIEFGDLNVSFVIEKELNEEKLPVPIVITGVQRKSIVAISDEINEGQKKVAEGGLIHRNLTPVEKIYYHLPAILRRGVWRYILRRPHIAYTKMGNVAFTSIANIAGGRGWFIPISVHPICFGMGSIAVRPTVKDGAVVVGEMLPITILMDHDVADGVYMAKFVRDLANNLENGFLL